MYPGVGAGGVAAFEYVGGCDCFGLIGPVYAGPGDDVACGHEVSGIHVRLEASGGVGEDDHGGAELV